MNSSFTKEAIDNAIEKLAFGVADNRIYCRFNEGTPEPIRKVVEVFLGYLNFWKTVGEFQGGIVHYSKLPPFPTPMGIRELKNMAYRMLLGQRIPSHMKLDITQRCQCKCLHCGASSNYNPARTELSTDEWKKLIDQCLDLGVTQFHIYGGEPLLRDDVVEIVRHIDKTKATCNLVTNGLLVTEKIVKELKNAGLYFLGVSTDYADGETHDENRGVKGSFDKVVKAIRLARESGLLVEMNTFISHGEAETGKLLKMIELARDLSVHVLTVFDYHPTGCNLHKMEAALTEKEKKLLAQQAHSMVHLDMLIALYFLQTDEDVCRQLLSFLPAAELLIGCPGGRKHCVITAYGDVRPCSCAPFTFGNVRHEGIRDIYERICSTEPYDRVSLKCRVLDPAYRAKYIDNVDSSVTFPIPFPGLKEPLPGAG